MFKLLVEFIGTFLFFSVILKHGQALPIAVALAAAIYFGGHISGGHFNSTVSLMMYLSEQMPLNEFLQYVGAQAAGAVAALYFKKMQE